MTGDLQVADVQVVGGKVLYRGHHTGDGAGDGARNDRRHHKPEERTKDGKTRDQDGGARFRSRLFLTSGIAEFSLQSDQFDHRSSQVGAHGIGL